MLESAKSAKQQGQQGQIWLWPIQILRLQDHRQHPGLGASQFHFRSSSKMFETWWLMDCNGMINGMINGMMRSDEIKWDPMRSNEFWPAKCSWHKVTTAEGMHLCIILFLLPPLLCIQRHETLRWCFRQRDLMTWWLPAYPSIIKIRRTYPSGALHQTLLLPTQQEAWGWP
jgi:hypothetical protein